MGGYGGRGGFQGAQAMPWWAPTNRTETVNSTLYSEGRPRGARAEDCAHGDLNYLADGWLHFAPPLLDLMSCNNQAWRSQLQGHLWPGLSPGRLGSSFLVSHRWREGRFLL